MQPYASPETGRTAPTEDQPGRDRHAQELIDGVSSLLRAVRGIEHRQRWPEEVGLGRADASVLRALARRGELRSGELAADLRVDASVVSRQLSALEAAGLVTRRPDPDDARVSLATLSPAGRDRVNALYAIFTAHLRAALSDLSDEDLSDAGRLLHRVADAVAAPVPASATRVTTSA